MYSRSRMVLEARNLQSVCGRAWFLPGGSEGEIRPCLCSLLAVAASPRCFLARKCVTPILSVCLHVSSVCVWVQISFL